MQFVFPSLAWGFLLILVPLLVHLINLMRHRRMQWAAMEFLLESYRKHRRWVWLKQAILLASRMLIMAVLVAMLAQWVSGSRWLSIFGETVTHHYLLLDDSYSMSDTTQGGSAYQKGLTAIRSILTQNAKQGGNHQVTLIRWSRATHSSSNLDGSTNPVGSTGTSIAKNAGAVGQADNPAVAADVAADLLARTLPSEPASLLERISTTVPTSLELSCEPSLKLVQTLLEQTPNQKGIVYLVSDFRKKDWNQPIGIRAALEQLKQRDVRIDLIDCVESQNQNLTIESIQPEEDTLAAGVPCLLRVAVQNHGSATARNVQVRIKTIDYGGNKIEPRPQSLTSGQEAELPSLLIEQIAPGETASRRVQVLFAQPGSQVVQASLPDDVISIDNRASCVLTIEQGNRVLLIDGAGDKSNAFFMDAALNPGGGARTGFLTERKEADYLRDSSVDELISYSSIILMSVPRLDERAIANLESYVQAGGGLGVFFGDLLSESDYDGYNRQWHRDGKGLLPVPLVGPTPLPEGEEGATDLIAEQHPIFQILLGSSNSPFQLVRVSRYVAIDERAQIAEGENRGSIPPRVIARLRNGAPYMLDSAFGKGRVVLFLSGLENRWTNWSKDPTFVVAALKMVGYLGSFRTQATSQRVGTPIVVNYSSREVLPEFDVILPPQPGAVNRISLSMNGQPNSESTWNAVVGDNLPSQTDDLQQAQRWPGITEVWTTRLQGDRQVRNYARNVAAVEGDLEKATSTEISQKLRPIEVRYRLASSIADSSNASGLASRSTLLMVCLIILLLVEQWLAWSASYHLPRVVVGGAR